jgi:hypothetical protein
VSYSSDQNLLIPIVDLVHHTVIAHANPIRRVLTREFPALFCSWLFLQIANRFDQALDDLCRQSLQFATGRASKLN